MKTLLDKLHDKLGDLWSLCCSSRGNLVSYPHAQGIRNNAHDGPGPHDPRGLHPFSSARERALSDCRRIRMLAQALAPQPGRDTDCSPQSAIQKLIAAAKSAGCFIDKMSRDALGELISKRTGESSVYFNAAESAYYKIKHPIAKAAIKCTSPQDWPFEHIIHNILFPDTTYEFLGVAEDCGEACFILKQAEVSTECFPTEDQVVAHLASLGLLPEEHYFFGNEVLSVTDVSAHGDNVLLGENNKLYFIDPLIQLKRPAIEVIDWLVGDLP